MNKTKFVILLLVILIPLAAAAQKQTGAVTIESIQILKVVPQDEKAIVKRPDGTIQIIKVGDPVGENGKVIEIIEGRIVIEERTDKGVETVIIRVENGKQRIERIRKLREREPILYSPTQKDKNK